MDRQSRSDRLRRGRRVLPVAAEDRRAGEEQLTRLVHVALARRQQVDAAGPGRQRPGAFQPDAAFFQAGIDVF